MYLKGHHPKGDWIDECKQSKSFPFQCFTPSLVAILSPKKLFSVHLSFFLPSSIANKLKRFQRHNYKVISTPWDSTMKNWKACIDDSTSQRSRGFSPHIIFIDLICKVKSIIKTNDDRGKYVRAATIIRCDHRHMGTFF